jgi:PPP family 3-phenylpropionic acid transporter
MNSNMFSAYGRVASIRAALVASGVILSPVLITLLADARLDARKIMAGLFILCGTALLLLAPARGFAALMLVWFMHNLALLPILPLQDGINFSIQRRRHELGIHIEPYHRTRVWGTIGYMIGGIPLFLLMSAQAGGTWVMVVAAICAALGAINALLLPDPLIRNRPDPAAAMPAAARIPTFAAASALLKQPLLLFCASLFLMNVVITAYGAFYPLYLTHTIGLDERWLSPIINIGVFVEIFFMFGFGRLSRWIGLRRLMILSVFSVAVRLLLLFAFPNVTVAILTQSFHGLTLVAIGIIPPIFLNQHADDRWRNSIQGLYAMFVTGIARIVGNAAAGPIARRSMTALFGYSGLLVLIATALIFMAFAVPHVRKPAESAKAVGGSV